VSDRPGPEGPRADAPGANASEAGASGAGAGAAWTPPPPPVPSVELIGVSKWFGDIVAVSDVSFSVGPGVTALLGPNGAGKSTVLRLLSGLTPPSRGQVRLLGKDPRADVATSAQIGIVPQQEGVFERHSALRFVSLAAVLHGVADPEAAARRALGVVELEADSPQPVGQFSKGMRQRLKVAQALVHDPHVLVLDEPLNGLDPRQRLHLIELFGQLGAEGRCVIVSSHVLEEVERFGSRILVISQGRLAAEGDFHLIRNLMDDRPRRFAIRSDRARELAAFLIGTGMAVGVELRGPEEIVVETHDAVRLRREVAPLARDRGARLTEVNPLDEDLESVFRYLVGR
jgi:ABC-2 type transport system ATP-binding protein